MTVNRPTLSHSALETSFSKVTMIPRLALLAIVCLTTLIGGCGKKTEAESVAEERDKLREDKRQRAIKYYKVLANDFTSHPKSDEANQRAAALEAQAKK